MSFVSDLVKSVVHDVVQDMLKKATGKRARRRKRTLTAAERLNRIEKLLKPARKQTSRKRTVSSRSKTRRRAS
ncbi:hypothetical protein SAMN04488498_105279 [Mesorhizobium albiziae]|uniref:Uncharacterized protein n=1 Tax=Neomesorhizobium albiziae TaxID=335020 RepID=A0A1I3Z148_9HYPH|nr:hypothetical protein [Mesorhizobium albiziae]GLS33172.1 hypothetical protein GCM10007937_48830 [Mesorhizobium albiziae]SFK37349.1 hypothetical protein SAMN04488498_105279 [Mesorhizobium albiziae]